MSEEAQWYVVHTYAGYENKVKANIEKIVENRNMQDQIHQVVVPMQSVTEIKNGQKKDVQKKVFPGYVLLKMEMNDDTWYVVRNTRGVTSFVGPGSKPVPLTEAEIANMGIDIEGSITVNAPAVVDDTVKITKGPFEGSVGVVKEIHPNKPIIVVNISIFGRETPVELDFSQIERV